MAQRLSRAKYEWSFIWWCTFALARLVNFFDMAFILKTVGGLCGAGVSDQVEKDPWHLPTMFPNLPDEEIAMMEMGHYCFVVPRKREMWLKL